MCGYYGGAKISKLRNTPDCEGYISKQKQSIEEIAKQFEAMEREAKKEINKLCMVYQEQQQEWWEKIRNTRDLLRIRQKR